MGDQKKKVDKAKLEELEAVFLRMVSSELERDVSNWEEYYDILKSSSYASDSSAEELKDCNSCTEKAEKNFNGIFHKLFSSQKVNHDGSGHDSDNTCLDQNPLYAKHNGIKVNVTRTQKQYSLGNCSKAYSQPSSSKSCSNTDVPDCGRSSSLEHTRANGDYVKGLEDLASQDPSYSEKGSHKYASAKRHQKPATSKPYYGNYDQGIEDVGRTKVASTKQFIFIARVKLLCFVQALKSTLLKGLMWILNLLVFIVAVVVALVIFIVKASWYLLVFFVQLVVGVGLWIIAKCLQCILFFFVSSNLVRIVKFGLRAVDILVLVVFGVPWRHFLPSYNPDDVVDEAVFDEDAMFPMPTDSESAIKHILRLRKSNPFTILCVPTTCTDEEIKLSYRKLVRYVHPDKCAHEDAEQAFKVLDSAFKKISTPEQRQETYDEHERQKAEAEIRKEYGHMFEEFEKQFEEMLNSMGCTVCQGRHKKVLVPDRSRRAARFCAECNTKHAASEGDVWTESYYLGMKWKCLACIDGLIYDLTDWGRCQELDSKLLANEHAVKCRLGSSSKGPRKSESRRQRREEAKEERKRKAKGRKKEKKPK